MSLRPFFTYFGGKWRAAPHYPRPEFGAIVEPFAGAAGYSLRYPERRVYLCDIDEAVCGVWDYLIHAPEAEIRRIPVDINHVDDLTGYPQEVRWLVGFWFNKAAAMPHLSRSAWAHQYPEQFWGSAIRERLTSQVEYIRHWQIVNASYSDVPDMPVTWFIDPPYAERGRHYRHGSRDIDYGHLANWCRGRSGQVIVCENEGADWLPFQQFRTIKATAGRGRTGVSREVIWTGDLRLPVVVPGPPSRPQTPIVT